jgi:hypothetical protein
MDYLTAGDVIERQQARLRAAMWWALPAFGLGLVGLGIGFLGAALASRPVQLLGFAVGLAGVALGIGAVVRTAWVIVEGVLRQK